MLNEKKILDKILMNVIFDRGFVKKLKLMKHIQNIFWIINKNILNGLLNYGAPDRVEPITSGAEIGALSS